MTLNTSDVSLNLEHKRIAVTGSALAIITIASFILMGWGVWMFTDYLRGQEDMLNRIDDRNSVVSSMRIEQCHTIQQDSVMVMKEVTEAIHSHRMSMDRMDHTITELQMSVDKNTAKIEQLIFK